jgi:1-acyl-sn-glycerol-3-phosphate acyltransferase
MENKLKDIFGHPVKRVARHRALHETIRLHLGFLLLGVICLVISVLAFPMRALLPTVLSKRYGRQFVSASVRLYLHVLTLMGACRFDLSELEALQEAPAMVIVPNHPSLLDALMILSRVPNTNCIMKAGIVHSLFFGAGARLMGFIPNTPLRAMVHLATADLHRGSHVLLFPEGTRTTRFPINELQGTAGLIAKHAKVPIQTIFIETNSGFLGKGWSLLWTPRMPITFRIRLGKRFAPPTHTTPFIEELAHYFQSELAHAELPDYPISGPAA